MGSRIKKYRMKAIPSAFSEKGGFSAQFIDEGVWNALGEMELPTTEGRVRFRVTTDDGEDTIVAETVG